MKLTVRVRDFTLRDRDDFQRKVGVPIEKAAKTVPVLYEPGEQMQDYAGTDDAGEPIWKDRFDGDGNPVWADGGERRLGERGRPVTDIEIVPGALSAFVWLTHRREDPSFTFEQAGDVRVTDLDLDMADEPLDPPSPAPSET